ncbi:MAG: C-GCAxxG-C-C family protein [Firmicutes bacterium]|nr:C-GCAxxG-C-C family protein [Bacillota bacterium]
MDKKEIARIKHEAGYNCAQAVACSFAEEIGMDENTLYRVCEGFGGGLGCAKGQCGALSGAVVLAGLKNAGGVDAPGQTKGATTKLSAAMLNIFVERAGALICKDIKTGNDGKPITSCADCISIAVDAVQEVLGL